MSINTTNNLRMFGAFNIKTGLMPMNTFTLWRRPSAWSQVTSQVSGIPGEVRNITYSTGSINVSWLPPSTGHKPERYVITPYQDGIKQQSVTTYSNSYRFDLLEIMKPYKFSVCAENRFGRGPEVETTQYFMMPPESLSIITSGSLFATDRDSAFKYVINAELNYVLEYTAKNKLGPTVCARLIYLWGASIVQAWNWVSADSRITGVKDNWDWTENKLTSALSDNDLIVWMIAAIAHITTNIISKQYVSIYNCPIDVINRVKYAGNWIGWEAKWKIWYDERAMDDSSVANAQPGIEYVNKDNTIIIDGTTVTDFSKFNDFAKWAGLTILNKKQQYLTYKWGDVRSTCLDNDKKEEIYRNVGSPKSGVDRDIEIDEVLHITNNLSDTMKILAEFWSGGPGSMSPPMLCAWLWKTYIMSLPDIGCSKIMWSFLDLSIHIFEGSIITWGLKTKHMECRPIQAIRRRYAEENIKSWNGDIKGSQWLPYQTKNFITPPFADFPSGHSHFSSAFAITMNKWFPGDIVKNNVYYDKQTLVSPLFLSNQTNTFGNFLIKKGHSEIEFGNTPKSDIILTFTKWDDIAVSAGMSRLYGGIHALRAHTASQSAATMVDVYINGAWNIATQDIIL